MKHKFVLINALVFAMYGVIVVAHATSLKEVCQEPPITITEDTKIESGKFDGDCTIAIDNAKLEIVGVIIKINGELEIKDVTIAGAAELIIKDTGIVISDRLKIENKWDRGVTFKDNYVYIGDDLRVKPVGHGDLIFENNLGKVGDDIRLGDIEDAEGNEGLNGDMDVRNNKIIMVNENDPPEFVAQSFNGDINIRSNTLGNKVEEIDIRSAGSGNIGVKNNRFLNTETVQEEIFITSKGGDVRVLNNRFGIKGIGEVIIESEAETSQCKSKRNRPKLVDKLACQN